MGSQMSFKIAGIIPNTEELSAMGRRRGQYPSVFKTEGKRPLWFFKARVDTLVSRDGARAVERPSERFYLGLVSEVSKREAMKLRDEILAEAINKPQVLIPSQVRFSEVLRLYTTDHLPLLRDTTQEMQASAIRCHLSKLGGHRMCDLDKIAVQRWLAEMELAYSTKKWTLALLRVIWNKALEWEYATKPFPLGKFALGVDRSQIKGHEMPTLEQLRKLLACLADPYLAMAEVALYSGLRISEIRGLQWGDFGADSFVVRRRVSIRGNVDATKNTKARVFDVRPLAGVLARMRNKVESATVRRTQGSDVLAVYATPEAGSDQTREAQCNYPRGLTPRRDGEFIFESAGSYSTCNDVMIAARKAAGITVARFGWHHLRAVFNTLVRQSGGDSLDRQQMMGHASERMNTVYVLGQQSDLKRRGDLMMQVQGLILGETKGQVQ